MVEDGIRRTFNGDTKQEMEVTEETHPAAKLSSPFFLGEKTAKEVREVEDGRCLKALEEASAGVSPTFLEDLKVNEVHSLWVSLSRLTTDLVLFSRELSNLKWRIEQLEAHLILTPKKEPPK